MKTSRVPRGKSPKPVVETNIRPRTPFSANGNSTSSYAGISPRIDEEWAPDDGTFSPPVKGAGIVNRIGPTTAASEIIARMKSDAKTPRPHPKKKAFNLTDMGYVPPNVNLSLSYRDVNHDLGHPVTMHGNKAENKDDDSMPSYHKFLMYGNSAKAAANNVKKKVKAIIRSQTAPDNSDDVNSERPSTARRPNVKKKQKGEPTSASARQNEKEPPRVAAAPFTARAHVSKSESASGTSATSLSMNHIHLQQNTDIRHLPEWLILAAEQNKSLEKLTNPATISTSSLSPIKTYKPTSPTRKDNQVTVMNMEVKPNVISTVKLTTPLTSRVSVMSRRKPNIPLAPISDKLSSSSLSSRSGIHNLQIGNNKPPKSPATRTVVRKPAEPNLVASQMQTTISSRIKSKPPARKNIPKKMDAKIFDGPAISKAIRAAVSAIKEMPTPQRVKRNPESTIISPVESAGSLKEKGSAKSLKGKKPAKGKGKKVVTKKSGKLNTPVDEFLGFMHHMVDQQLWNLSERQKALEREVFHLFDGLQQIFSTTNEQLANNEVKCCCNEETQEKMKTLLQKQREVIQLQIDLRKRYGLNMGQVVPVGPNEPILNGFNAHFDHLAPYARDIEGETVYYCSACNIACDNELAFRRHLEGLTHVQKAWRGIQSTEPIYTCDDCEQQLQGTTKYMSHVINNNVHNSKSRNSSTVIQE